MKTYIVTGVVQGIGKAIRQELFSAGHKVIGIDKQEDTSREELLSNFSDQYEFHQFDLADRGALGAFIKNHELEIDGVVNNAGEVYLEKWEEFSIDTWDRTLAVNLTSIMMLAHGLSGYLKKGGAIVNIASVDGTLAAFDTIAYAVSKAGVINLTQSLAAILGPRGIRVNAIAPGWVETEMVAGTLPPEASEMAPLGRNGKPEDIAQTVAFLLSEKASFITAQTISVDGGLFSVDYTLWKESQM